MSLLYGDMSPEFGSPGLGLRTDLGRPAKRLWGGGRWRTDGCGLRRVRHGRTTRGYTISQSGRWTMQGRERSREGRRYDDDVRFDTPRRGEADGYLRVMGQELCAGSRAMPLRHAPRRRVFIWQPKLLGCDKGRETGVATRGAEGQLVSKDPRFRSYHRSDTAIYPRPV